MDILKDKAEIIDKIIAAYQKKHEHSDQNLPLFAKHFFQRASLDYLQQLKISDLVLYLEFSWSHIQKRSKDQPNIHLNKKTLESFDSPRYILSITNYDRPFIVDSLLSFLNTCNLKSEFIVHPVLYIERDKKGQLINIGTPPSIQNDHYVCPTESCVFIQFKETKNFDADTLLTHLHDLFEKLYWAVDDWPRMKSNLQKLKSNIGALSGQIQIQEDREDVQDLITWLLDRHFIFLGARYSAIETHANKSGQDIFCLKEKRIVDNLGLFRSPEFDHADDLVPGFARAKPLFDDQHPTLPARFPLVTVTKMNQRSPIHRSSRIDSIEIIDINEQGNLQGIQQFIGIFTKNSFYVPAFEVPILKRKARRVFERFGLNPKWHDGKSLIAILDSIPRDEMFYLSEDELTDISQRVLHMKDTGNIVLFTRPDTYGLYITVIVFMPRNRYSFALKDKLESLICKSLGGTVTSSVAHVGDLPFARVVYIVAYDKPQKKIIDVESIERDLTLASLSWVEYLERILSKMYREDVVSTMMTRYRDAFDPAYREKFEPDVAEFDLRYIEKISETNNVDIYLYPARESSSLKLKIFHYGEALSLSTLLPILYNLGLKVTAETTYHVKSVEKNVYIHDFEVESDAADNWHKNAENLTHAFKEIWVENIENDGLNQLILKANLACKDITILRAYSRFLQQAKIPFSIGYVESALILYPQLTRLLVDLFIEKFNPHLVARNLDQCIAQIKRELQNVNRSDHDRILRRFLNAIMATIRTNYFQKPRNFIDNKNYISLKFICSELEDLPQPRPLYEIFVYSPRVEAVHLRGGKVARGGIRWSDRFEDFRTEVLGLMKAQMVKNSVIVPGGSKGGFIVKRQEQFNDRTELMKEVISCYETMMCGLLDITDNMVDGEIVRPEDTVRYDEDDPYLVVAADKGTATFSDIANKVSQQYGFWLDDAFASGGSAGYDHKKMAITSRGAWESVKRHFREMGHDVQKTPFSVVGVGDMAGDVFGNGMLRSDKIRLLAAFNHQHIFIDPNPIPATSFSERQRLFNLPRSAWSDYNPDLLSKGGGIFLRSAKTISLTPEIQEAFGIQENEMSPDHLIQHLLRAPVDLLWFGGIGTFIKAQNESHADVGDVANNGLRIDGRHVRARVIGEGANLGMTQQGRIEYALNGGRLNTDAIDNSAGVDCSDHEVNIKILFSLMHNKINRSERDVILREMTDEVAHLVLEDNYRQTQILTIMASEGARALTSYQHLIKQFEAEANLNRDIEFLPDDETLDRRKSKNQGLTRPELAVLLAYAKISICDQIRSSNLVDDIFFHPYLKNYFPKILAEKFEWAINRHPLRAEIITTVLANTMINRVGITFVYELTQASGKSIADVVKSFFHAIELLGLNDLWAAIDALDEKMLNQLQIDSYHEIAQILRSVVLWLLRHRAHIPLSTTSIFLVQKNLSVLVEGEQQIAIARKIISLSELGLEQETAEKLAVLPHYAAAIDIASHAPSPEELLPIASSYFALRARFGLDWLCVQIHNLSIENDWQRAAQLSLLDDLSLLQSSLIRQVMASGYVIDIQQWLSQQKDMLKKTEQFLHHIQANGRPDFGMISFAIGQMQRIIGMK